VVVVDYAYEPDDFTRPVNERWGALIISQLRGWPATQEVRVIVQSRYLTHDVRQYLAAIGLPPRDVIDPHGISLKERARLIDGNP
jgi:hypothetical protein